MFCIEIMAKIYPKSPRPKIPPVAISLIRDFCLNSSLLYIFEIWSSMIGFLKISKASLIATGGIFGLGAEGYILAIISIQKILQNENR